MPFWYVRVRHFKSVAAAAAAKLLQSCPTLCSPIDGSPPASPVPELKQHLHVDILYYSISVQLLGSTDYFRYFTMLFFHRKITLSRKISRAGLKNCEFFSYSFQYLKKKFRYFEYIRMAHSWESLVIFKNKIWIWIF